MPGINVRVDGEESILKALGSASTGISSIMYRSAGIMETKLKQEIYTVFEVACSSAGAGFPAVYTQQLLGTLSTIPLFIDVTSTILDISFDPDLLGTYEEFSEGFHYHASLQGGGKVELPYGGEALKNTPEQRYQFWLSVATGTHIPGMPKVEGSLAETYAARVSYWESIGKAPQWLLLNYGQGEYYPYVRPYPIVETITATIGEIFYQTLNIELDRNLRENFKESYVPEYGTFKSRPNTEYIRGAGGRFIGSRRRR